MVREGTATRILARPGVLLAPQAKGVGALLNLIHGWLETRGTFAGLWSAREHPPPPRFARLTRRFANHTAIFVIAGRGERTMYYVLIAFLAVVVAFTWIALELKMQFRRRSRATSSAHEKGLQ
jgi:hypothetical protein